MKRRFEVPPTAEGKQKEDHLEEKDKVNPKAGG